MPLHKNEGCEIIGCPECRMKMQFRKDISENMDSVFNESMQQNVTNSIEKSGNQSLRLKDLFEAKKNLDRYDKVYLVECSYLPDDCYGIMYVRKEDMPKCK